MKEKKFIEKAISDQKMILGICLGAQLLADVLGAKVCKNRDQEIGWHPVTLTELMTRFLNAMENKCV